MKKTLSVVYATFNEEKNLPLSLDSLKDIADEIIIVDGTSTDKTVEIAKKYGAIVKITTNKSNFHINKQMAIDLAKKDWVLQMDADEHLSPELKEEINEILKKDNDENSGYWMPRKNWFLGRFLLKGGQYPDYTIRLYKKGKGKLPQKDVHEQAEVKGKVGYLKSALLHYPYSDFKHYLKKWNLYNNFFAQQIEDELSKKNIFEKLFYAIMYLFVRPSHWLFTTFLRHKGFVDSWQGFVFSLFSALRFPVSFIKYFGVYRFSAILIVIFGSILRLWNFPQRWGLGGDDGRDALVALEALRRLELPLVGSFSSAGPFVFGGIFYWFVMISYAILPFLINAPWIMLEIISIVTLISIMYLGKLIKGEKMAIVIGLLAATSPQLIIRSLSLGQHTFIALLSVLSIILLIQLHKKKKMIYALLLGISVGAALSFHYQAINLLIFFPVIFILNTLSFKQRINAFIFMLFGFILPSLPILIWDAKQNFANINNILDYFLIAQNRIYVPNSWRLFIFHYMPQYWSFVVGNYLAIGLFLFLSSLCVFIYSIFKKRISTIFFVIGLIFAALLFVSKFYKGERSEGYQLYFLPFVLIFSAYFIFFLFESKFKISKLFAIFLIIFIIFANFTYNIKVLNDNSGVDALSRVKAELYRKYPNDKFSIYDYKYKLYSRSMALSLLMTFDNKTDFKNGRKIGISCYGKECPTGLPVIVKDGLLIVDLENVNKDQLVNSNQIWINVNRESVYEDLIGWLHKNNLKSNFDLKKYIINKL